MLLGKCLTTIAHVFLVQEPFDTEFYPIDHICKSASPLSCNLLCSDHCIHKPTSRQSPIYKYRRRSNKEERLTRKQNCLLNSCWQAEIMLAAPANKSTSIDSCARGSTSAPEWRRYLLAWEPSATQFYNLISSILHRYNDRVLYPRDVIKFMSSIIANCLDPFTFFTCNIIFTANPTFCIWLKAGWLFHDWIFLFHFYHHCHWSAVGVIRAKNFEMETLRRPKNSTPPTVLISSNLDSSSISYLR